MRSVYRLAAVFIIFFVLSCRDAKQANRPAAPAAAVDTFWLCDKLVQIDSIKRSEFDEIRIAPDLDSSEEIYLLRDSAFVKRHGDSLIFTAGGKEIVLINNHSDTSDATADHNYRGFNRDLGKYIVYSVYWEWYNYMLIDKGSGDTTVICGEPVLSPDKKFFICGNADLLAQFTFNGFELYENLPKPKLICQRELMKWGPQEIKWIAKNTLLVKATVADTTIQDLERPAYYKLSIK